MPDEDITELLNDWAGGDKSSLEALTPLVYDQLRRIAARSFRGERLGLLSLAALLLLLLVPSVWARPARRPTTDAERWGSRQAALRG